MKHLVKGLHHFRNEVFEEKKELFERLGKGQSPRVAFVTCSDSRVNPALITQSDPGELFILRNAGNLIPPADAAPGGEAASLQYAIEVLKVSDLIICGHSHCGAVNHLLRADQSPSALPYVDNWVTHASKTIEIMRDEYGQLEGADRLNVGIQENVLVQIGNARTYPFVEEAYQAGRLRLYGWVYKIETGEVFCYDYKEQQFYPVEQMFPLELKKSAAGGQSKS